MVNPDNLIPPDSELAQHLLQWSEEMDNGVWEIANVTNELIEEIEGNEIKRSDIYRAISRRCKGQKPNTIRRWAEVAADFDKDTQFQYAQLLSFNHFRTSRRLFKEGYTPSIEYGLEWCVSGNDDTLKAGTFHTVGQMINQFIPKEKLAKPIDVVWDKVKDYLYDNFLMVDNDYYRDRLLGAWHEVEYIVQSIDKQKES